MFWFKLKYKIHRLLNWEYWPAWTLYVPFSIYYLCLVVRARSFGFFSATNPSMKNGGMASALKSEIEALIPAEWHPKTAVFQPNHDFGENILEEFGISFPCIAKPDDGCRGTNVQKINNLKELQNYSRNINQDFLIQEYINLPFEVGIFYFRYPNENQGFITGMVEKKGITVVGNGKNSIGDLINFSYRYHKFYNELFLENEALKNTILKAGEKVQLSSIGNHARGSTFYDITHKKTAQLENTIDNISKRISGFYYGRFDIKYNTWNELEQGINFKIIELNGAMSEPTHMYDPSHSYFFALNELRRHWKIMYQISKQNKAMGHPYMSIPECYKMIYTIGWI